MIFDAHFSVRERPDFSAGFSHQAVVLLSRAEIVARNQVYLISQ